MAVLYLGTCQARSEATHFNNADVNLHSWVSPSTSGLLTDSKAPVGGIDPIVKVTPSQPQSLCLSCPHMKATFGLSYDENGSSETKVSQVWLVNDHPTDSTGTTFTFAGYGAGQYTVACRVTTSNLGYYYTHTSNYVVVTVDGNAIVNIIGPDHACQNDVVTLTAQVENTNLEATYQWRRDGQYIVGATGESYSFLVDTLPGLTDTLVYEFDVQISIAGCDNKFSPVHYFSVSPTPVTFVDVPLFCKGASSVIVTANSYTSGDEHPYMWKWTKVGTTEIDTTYVNYFAIPNPASGDEYKVIPVYQDFACNADTATFKLISYQDSLHLTADLAALKLNTEPDFVCQNGMAKLTINDPNKAKTELGHATYQWYMNGTPIPGVTDTMYVATLPNTGSYEFHVVASYENYPCENPTGDTIVMVDTIPAAVTITGQNMLCQNQDGTYTGTILTARVVPTEGTFEYKWNGHDFGTDSTLAVDTPGVYSVIVKSAHGCETVSMPFEVFGFGSSIVITRTEVACAGQPVNLTANTQGWNGSVSYEWSNGEHSPSITVNPDADTWYKVTSTATLSANTSCTRTDSIHVLVVPAPTTPIISAIGGTSVCPDGIARVYVTNAKANTYYKWYVNGTMISAGAGLDTLVASLTNPGQNIIKVEADSLGCSSAVSNSVLYTVDTTINNITITGGNVLCQNGDGTYSDTTLVAVVIPTGTYQYKWSGQTTFGTDSSYKVTQPGVYTVTVKTANGCEFSSDPFEVQGFGANIQITQSEVNCAGEPVVLNVNAIGWTGNVSYKWDNIDGNYNEITVYPTKDSVFKVTSTVDLGNGETCSRRDSIHVYVLPVNATIPTVTVAQDSICEGSLAQVRVTNHIAGNHYKWYQNGIEIPGHNLDTIAVVLDVAGDYVFAAAVITANGCTSAPSDTALVRVKAVPTLVNITGDPVVCENDSTVLKAHVSPEITDAKYKWSTGSDADSIVVQAGTYTVTVTNGADLIGCSATAEYTVTSFGSEVQVTATPDIVCAGYDVTLNAQLTGWDNSNITYQWYDGNGTALTNGTSNQVTTAPSASGWYIVESTASSSHGECTRRDSVYVTVESISVDSAKIVGEDTICFGTQTVLVAYATGADHFIWFENGIEIPGENLDTIRVMPAAPGSYTYSVAAVSLHGCQSNDTTLVPDVFVLNNPTVQITGDPILCNDSNVRLIAYINDTTYTTAGNHEYTYEWRLYNHTLNTSNTVNDTTIAIDGVDYKFTIDSDTLKSNLKAQDHPYIFTVSITNENGCVATSAPYDLYVGDTVAVAVTIDYDTICEGGLVTATAHLGDYNMDNLVYQWYEINLVTGDTTMIPHGTSRIYETYVDTSKILMVNVTNNQTMCTVWGQDSVFVLPLKLQKILATNETHLANEMDTLKVCKGEAVYLTAYVLNTETNETYVDTTLRYVWYENGFLMPGVDGPRFHKQLDILDDDTLSYQYTAYIDFGIDGCEPKLVASNVVFVKRNPVVTISGHHNVCYFGRYEETGTYNVHLIAWVDGQYDRNLTYTWYEHNQERFSVDGSIYHNHYRENWEGTFDNPFSFTVKVADSNGCVTYSEPFEVNVYNKPQVNITASETTICKGGQTALAAHIVNYNDPYLIYQWYKNGTDPDNAIPGMNESNEIFTVEDTTTYLVKVTHLLENGTLEGQACYNIASIVINANDIPVIDSVTTDLAEGNDTICEGRYVTFTAHMSKGVAGGELYTWYRNGEVIAETPDSVYRETPEALNGDITVWDYAVKVKQAASGCESEIVGADTITVFPNPVLRLVTDPIVCDTNDLNIKMYANVTPIPTSSYRFTWFEDNSVDTLAAATDVVYSGAHQDTVMIKRAYRDYPYSFAVEMVNEYGCTTRDDALIYVNDNPVVHAISTEYNICQGGAITLTANLDDYNADMLEFHWYDVFNGDTTDMVAATNMTYSFVPDSIGEHKYFMTALQRTSLCIAQSNDVVVKVDSIPVIDSVTNDLAAANDTICEGRFVTLTAHVHGGVRGGEVYTWYRNGAVIPTAHDSIYVETPEALNGDVTTYHYAVSVKQTAAGCESDTTQAAVVTVFPNPVLRLVTDPIVCDTLDLNIKMYANINPIPTSPYRFTWFEDNSVDTLAAATDVVYSGAHQDTVMIKRAYRDYPYSFAVEMVNEYGCTTRDDALIYVNDNPVVHAISTEYNICEGGQITLTANLDDYNADMLEFHWYDVFNGDTTDMVAATEMTYTFVPDSIGEHNYFMTALQRTSLCIAQSNNVKVTVDSIPVIDSVTNDLAAANDTICEGRFVTLTAHVHGGVRGGEVYTWYRNGAVIPTAHDSIYVETPEALNGDVTTYHYAVSVKQTAAGCESDTTNAAIVTVFPNPVLRLVTDPIVCDTLDFNIKMYANINPIPTSPYHFTWFEDNSVDTLAAAADVVYSGAHQDTVIIKRDYREYPYSFAVEMVNEYGCTTRDDAQIIVMDNPVVHAISTEYNICEGGQITLTANLDDYNADMLEFHWYDVFNGDTTDMVAATNMTYTFVPDSIGEHKYFMTALQRTSLCIAQSNDVVVKVDSIPVIDSVTNDLAAANDTICEGRFVTLTAHVHGGVRGGEVYTWYRNGAVIPTAHDSIYVETPEALNGDVTTYHYAVSVRQTAAGCESDTTNAAIVTVFPNPVLRLVTDPIVCDTTGMNVVMYANVTPIPTSPYRFKWFEDNSADTLVAAADMVEYYGEHNDSIKLHKPYRDYAYSFAVEMVNQYGCTVRDDANVQVNDNPVVHARVSDPVICVGGEITLTANLDDYNADMLEFHWYDSTRTNGKQLIGVATELDYTVVPSLDTHYYYMTALQRTSGCIAGSDPLMVIVKVDPVIKKVVLSDYIACEGAQVRIEAIPDSNTYTPRATDVYTWYRNGIRIPGATNRVLYDSPVTVDQNTQQYVYTAVVTLEEPGCTSLPVASQPLTIYRNPVVAITGDQHVCETDYTLLIANVDTIGMSIGNLNYTWYVDNAPNPNMAYNLGNSRFFADYLFPRDEAYRVQVSVERAEVANACASMSEVYEVYVYPKPEVNITPNVSEICENGEVTLQANLRDYNADHITFQWYEIRTATEILAIDYLPGGGYVYDTVTTHYNYYIPGATGFRYTTTLSETTTIGVKVFQTNSECYDIDETTIIVHPTPAAPVITVNHPMICSNGDVDLVITNDYSEYGTPTYEWMLNGHVIPGTYGPVYHQEPGLVDGTTHHYNAIVTFNMPGCMSFVSDTADVVVIPDPEIRVTVDGPTTICEGGAVTFNAVAQPTTLNYTYQWYNYDNQLMEGETQPTLTVSPAANQQSYQYIVVVNSLPGCQQVVEAPVVTVVADPIATLSIDKPVICQGGFSTLTVDVLGGDVVTNGVNPYVYNWYNNVNTETPFATTSVNFLTLDTINRTDSIVYWVEVSANAYGCAATSNNVNQKIVADPVVAIIVAPTCPATVCDGGTTMLVATVDGGVGEPSYQWYRNGTILVGETNPTLNTGILSVNDIQSFYVIVKQTGSGCETVSDTFSVPVIPSYNVVVSALNNPTVCEGGTTTLEATITNDVLPNDNISYQWYEKIDGADVAITGATSTRFTTSPLLTDGNHTYFVAVTSQITGSHCSANSNSFYTAIVNDPTVTISTTSVNNVVCQGDVVRVNATVNHEGSEYPEGIEYTYTWTWTNGTNSYSFTNNEPTFAPAADELPASTNGYLFNVSIASTDANSGCNANSTDNVYVTVMARPVVTITADNAIVCAGGQVELTANHNASDYTGFNYAWTVNGQPVHATSQTITVPASMVTEGNINATVLVTSSQLTLECTSTASLTSPVQVVPSPTVTAAADFTTMCAGAAPTLTATVHGDQTHAPLTYVWQLGGSEISSANGSVYQTAPLAAGTYSYKVKVLTQDQDLNCASAWSEAVVLKVAETPVIGLTSADGLALCEGGNITLTATVLNASDNMGSFTNGDIYGSYTYVWKKNNNTVATTTNSALPQNQITETLNTVGNYNYVAYVTPVGQFANGCGVANSEPLQVVVNAKPNWDAAVVYPVGNICLGEEVQLHAHITGGVTDMNGNTNGHIQWVVEFNGVPSNVANFGGDATHTPAVPGLYTYYPTYVPYEGTILGSGCTFSNSDQVSTFVTVHELPTAAFVSGDGSVVCANVSDDNAALTIHFTGTAPFHFIVTDLSNGTTQMYDAYTNDYTLYVSPSHTTQYRITYLSDNYCDNGQLGMDAIATVFVNDIQFSESLFMAECDVNEVTIDFNMISGTPNSEFTVTYDNGLVVTGTIVNNTATFATPDVPGDYHAVFSVGGCNYDIIVRRPIFTSEFATGDQPFMMQRWDDVAIINNNPATNGGHTFVSYQWYRNGELIPGAIYKNYQEVGGLNGFYSIEVVSREADGSIVTYRTCEQYFTSNSSVKVYPVPATVQQVVTVELDMTAEELVDATLDIYDAVGAIVNHITNVEPITKVAGFKAAGTYFGRITLANGETKTVKFVIVK